MSVSFDQNNVVVQFYRIYRHPVNAMFNLEKKGNQKGKWLPQGRKRLQISQMKGMKLPSILVKVSLNCSSSGPLYPTSNFLTSWRLDVSVEGCYVTLSVLLLAFLSLDVPAEFFLFNCFGRYLVQLFSRLPGYRLVLWCGVVFLFVCFPIGFVNLTEEMFFGSFPYQLIFYFSHLETVHRRPSYSKVSLNFFILIYLVFSNIALYYTFRSRE